MTPDEPTDEERLEELSQDNETPFRPTDVTIDDTVPLDDRDAQNQANSIPDDHPLTDTNIQPEETYDEGYAGSAEANEPNAGNAVTGYSPEKDKRNQSDGMPSTESTDDESIGSSS